MLRTGVFLAAFLTYGFFNHSFGQVKPDLSQEAVVVEKASTVVAFENDGGETRTVFGRVRIQSEAGVKKFSVIETGYQASAEKLDVDFVRVHKADGTVIATPADNVQDLDAEITRQAPLYSDLRQKHVAVRGLGVGDVLEFQTTTRTTKPLVPGQFWGTYNLSDEAIVLDEVLQISVPRGRAVKWKSSVTQPQVTEEGARRVFRWTYSKPAQETKEEKDKAQEKTAYQASRARLPQAEIQISSFGSWEEVGRWYDGLQRERAAPTPEIRAKAAALTKDLTSDEAKARALYSYVSLQVHYIGIDFGIGRYQPHFAADVLANQYGDCKDKHTLLAALLAAVGVKAYPALVSTGRDVDADVPSPAQFDHVITVLPQGGSFTWLDTTPAVAPFAVLWMGLRGKAALVVEEKPELVTPPAKSGRDGVETYRIDAKLSDTGTLEGRAQYTESGGDAAMQLRGAFRGVPEPKWKELMQQISYATGFAGEVEDVVVSSPEKVEEPLRFGFHYTRKDYPDWGNHRLTPPSPPMLLPGLPEEDRKPAYPVWLGGPGERHYESHVELPKGYWAELPRRVDLVEDFAEYHAAYSVQGGKVTTDRRLVTKVSEVPLEKVEAYKKFLSGAAADQGVQVLLSKESTLSTYQESIWVLPVSENKEAAQAYEDARARVQAGDVPGELAALKRAVELDPKYVRAWLWIGETQKAGGHMDQAVESYEKALQVDPGVAVSYKALGGTLLAMHRVSEAALRFRELVRVAPEDLDGYVGLAATLCLLKNYDEAVTVLEQATQIAPDLPNSWAVLGETYLQTSGKEKALPAMRRAVEMDRTPQRLNREAMALAEANQELETALEFAKEAVARDAAASSAVRLDQARDEDLNHTRDLAADWGTLGWVYFRQGKFEAAEKYLRAAWVTGEEPEVANRLGHLYEAQKKKAEAAHLYRLTLERTRLRALDSQQRLEAIDATPVTHKAHMDLTDELNALRTVKLPQLVERAAMAEFLVVLGEDGKSGGAAVKGVKFISGSDLLKDAGHAIQAATFGARFPDGEQPLLLRRGIVDCGTISGCSLTLLYPADAKSVN